MSAALAPTSVAELVEVVGSYPRLLAVGAQTKSRLSAVNVTKVSTRQLRGIVEYEPSEFTFTALAGTPLRDLASTLAAAGQYLPFDPLLAEAGATLGGTVAAGVSGPGRFRFGGIRDFILGIQFIDGRGRPLRMGGKVVKNAAGFDLPKFFVGSLGRFGVLTELTFKVFPAAASTLTLKLPAKDVITASRILMEIGRAPWEADALDLLPGGCDVGVRLAGPAQALEKIALDILGRWPGEQLPEREAQQLWSALREFRWAHSAGALVKVALTPAALPDLYSGVQFLDGATLHVSSGSNQAFVSLPDAAQLAALDQLLRNLALSAVTLRGEGPLWCGAQPRTQIAEAVKQALDPQNRFPGLED